MTRTRRTDCWQASVRISIPIDASDVGSIQRAQESVAKLAALIPGSAVEITHAGFGRMAAPTPGDLLAMLAPRELPQPPVNVVEAMADIRQQLQPEPELPESLRRVPRIA